MDTSNTFSAYIKCCITMGLKENVQSPINSALWGSVFTLQAMSTHLYISWATEKVCTRVEKRSWNKYAYHIYLLPYFPYLFASAISIQIGVKLISRYLEINWHTSEITNEYWLSTFFFIFNRLDLPSAYASVWMQPKPLVGCLQCEHIQSYVCLLSCLISSPCGSMWSQHTKEKQGF